MTRSGRGGTRRRPGARGGSGSTRPPGRSAPRRRSARRSPDAARAPRAPRRVSAPAFPRIDSATPTSPTSRKQRGDAHALDVLLGKVESAGQPLRIARDSPRVGRGALAPVDRLGQRHERREARAVALDADLLGPRRRLVRVAEDHRAVAPGLLGLIAGAVRGVQELARGAPVRREGRHPAADRQVGGLAGERRVDLVAQPLGEQQALPLVGLRRERPRTPRRRGGPPRRRSASRVERRGEPGRAPGRRRRGRSGR